MDLFNVLFDVYSCCTYFVAMVVSFKCIPQASTRDVGVVFWKRVSVTPNILIFFSGIKFEKSLAFQEIMLAQGSSQNLCILVIK